MDLVVAEVGVLQQQALLAGPEILPVWPLLLHKVLLEVLQLILEMLVLLLTLILVVEVEQAQSEVLVRQMVEHLVVAEQERLQQYPALP